MAWNGRHFLVVYAAKSVLYGQLLDSDGRDAASRFVVLPQFGVVYDFDVAASSSGFMVAANAAFGVSTIPVTDAGVVSSPIVVATFVVRTAIRSNGQTFLLVMHSTSPELRVAVIGANGMVIARARSIPLPAGAFNDQLSATWNGAAYIIAADGLKEIMIARVAADGIPIDATPIAVASGHWPSVASTGTTEAIAFADASFINTAPYPPPDTARAFTLSGNHVAPLPGLAANGVASITAANEDLPAAATNPFGTLVVWRETLGKARTLRTGHLSATNQWGDGAGAPLPGLAEFEPPAVATNGDLFLVTWMEGDRLRGVRVDRNGGVIDPVPIEIAHRLGPLYSGATVTWTGKSFAVIFARDYGLAAARVSAADGHVIDARVIVASIDNAAFEPAAAFNGQTLVIAYEQSARCAVGPHFEGCPNEVRLESIALDPELNLRTPRPTILGEAQGPPKIEWNGGGFVISWRALQSLQAAELDAEGRLARPAHAVPPGERSASGALEFFSLPLDDAPFYGAQRIVVSSPHPRTPPAPTNVKLTGSLLTWDSTLAGAFHIEARIGTSAYEEIALVNADARSAVVDVPAGAAIRIRAWSVDGMSEYAEVTTIPAPRRRAAR